ncbi:radical SAM protein [bacterium]|nr:radical SAM protein [candidate division CSSED10-310 bacterium]
MHRFKRELGFCHVGASAVIAAALPHKGEEPPLVKRAGSGTVFFSHCNAACLFCQNYQISHQYLGHSISIETLSGIYLSLQKLECSNLNWVSPTPHLPFALKALSLAMKQGFSLPLVYNTNGYMRQEILDILDGIVDIYLPDMKYAEDIWALKFSGLENYVATNVNSIKTMIHQRGPLEINSDGEAVSGVLIRHLILPGGISGSARVFRTIAAIDTRVPVSIMSQYRPRYLAENHPFLGHFVTREEFERVIEEFENSGLENGYTQDWTDHKTHDSFFPDFTKPENDIFS